MPLGILLLALQVGLAVHAARTGRMYPWLWIIVFVPALGSLLYVIIELVPELTRSRSARKLGAGVVQTVDPGRSYRALAREVEIAPTVFNKLRLAEECLRLGRATEAVQLYEACATGLHASDPAIRSGLARARFAAGDFPGTIAELDRLRHDTPDQRSADGHLLYARALDGASRTEEAAAEYKALVDYAPGEEARCRYAELLSRMGRTTDAREQYQEIVRRVSLQDRGYRRAQREWYDAASRAMASG